MTLILEKRAATVLFNILISNGDKRPVLIPANVCPIVPITFMKAWQPFDFVDISPDTFCMDESASLSKLRTGKYAGIFFVRTYGIGDSFEKFFARVKEISPRLLVIDDRCLCPPVVEESPTAADLVLFSTGMVKVVDIGFGGYAWIKPTLSYKRCSLPFDKDALETLEMQYKQAAASRTPFIYADSDWLDTSAVNVSIAEYFAAVQKKLTSSLEHKAALNSIFSSHLPIEIQLPAKYQNWRFNILVPERMKLLARIFAHGLFASSHYDSLPGVMQSGRAPEAEKLHSRIINLFNDFHMDQERALTLLEIINDHVSSHGNFPKNKAGIS